MNEKRRVGVLMGGLSAEREVSLRTGDGVAAALEAQRARRRAHRLRAGDRAASTSSCGRRSIDVAFLALHGRGGEDGCVQGLLELLGIPYTGSSVLASALAMDKLKAKEMFRLHNVPTPPYYVATARRPRGPRGACTAASASRSSSSRAARARSVGAREGRRPRELARGASSRARVRRRTSLVERFVAAMEVARGHPRRPRARRHRDRPEERPLRLRVQVHGRA